MKSFRAQMLAKWKVHGNEIRKANGGWARVMGLDEALEVADRADKEIAELKLRIALMDNETA